MGDILILIIGIILIVLGIIGSILPVLPGPPLSFAALFILRFTTFVEQSREAAYDRLLWIFAFVVIVVTIFDYIVPIAGAKKFGGSKAGMIGAGLGIIAGLFFPPAGLILGPFLGAFLAELISGKDERTAIKAGFGSFLGFLTGILFKLTVSVLITFYFIREIFLYWFSI